MNKEQRDQLAGELLAEAEHRRGRVVDLLRNAAAALTTPPAAQVQGEREDFEAWGETLFFSSCFEREDGGDYVSRGLQGAWLGWQARAALSAPPAADAESAEELATRLIEMRAAVLGHAVPWAQAIEITAIVTKMPDEERAALLALDDATPAAGVPDLGARPQTCNGKRCGWCKEGAEPCHYTPPASEQPQDAAQGCGYQNQHFGAPYPDAQCVNGYLWDEDSCEEPGGPLLHGGDIPCPQCNVVEYVKYMTDSADLIALIDRHRIELLPEYDAGYIARAYSDQSEPVAEAVAKTAHQALTALLSQLQLTSAMPSQGGDL